MLEDKQNIMKVDTDYNYYNSLLDSKAYNESLSNIWTTDNLSYVYSQTWDNILAETSHITSIGNIIYTIYPIWLILTSIILLLAMVGSIVITIKE